VQQFYERLGRVERITNVSDLRLGTLISNTGAVAKKYDYGANETVIAVCTVTTFFSKEESEAEAAAAAASSVKGKPGAKAAPAKAPPKPAAAR
jgi:hypothetical protein